MFYIKFKSPGLLYELTQLSAYYSHEWCVCVCVCVHVLLQFKLNNIAHIIIIINPSRVNLGFVPRTYVNLLF